MNTRSVVKKLSKFQGFVYSSDFSIVCTTETCDIFDNKVLPSGYSIYRKDRDSRGGGVLLAIKDSFSSSRLPSPSDIETVSVLISSQNSIIICAAYVPPNANDNYHELLCHYVPYRSSPQ